MFMAKSRSALIPLFLLNRIKAQHRGFDSGEPVMLGMSKVRSAADPVINLYLIKSLSNAILVRLRADLKFSKRDKIQ